MDLFVEPTDPFNVTLEAPPSKYVTHRAVFITSLMGGTVSSPSMSEDCVRSIYSLKTLGSKVIENGKDLTFEPIHDMEETTLDVGDSGTTARFLMALSLLSSRGIEINGGESLSRRPMDDSAKIIENMGGKIEFLKRSGYLPLRSSGPLNKKYLEVSELKSSQILSGLLILSAALDEGINLGFKKYPSSFGYIRTTIDTLAVVGVDYKIENNEVRFIKKNMNEQARIRVPGDFGSAAFFLVASALTHSTIKVRNLDEAIFQPDSEILKYLVSAGAKLIRDRGTISLTPFELNPIKVDLTGTPDLFPIMAVLASGINGVSLLKFSGSLMYKESDRIATTSDLLKRLGVSHEVEGDIMIIKGGKIKGGEVDSHGDHRIAMAGAIAGLASESGVLVKNFEVHRKSYPTFLEDLRRIAK